jgi:antitoxin (DNA-binding transcriptional repressor) of toxin-antitoxin stability system
LPILDRARDCYRRSFGLKVFFQDGRAMRPWAARLGEWNRIARTGRCGRRAAAPRADLQTPGAAATAERMLAVGGGLAGAAARWDRDCASRNMDHMIWSIDVNGSTMSTETDETVINVTAFKSQCLALIDAVAQGKVDRVVLTRHGRPVAALVPFDRPLPDLWGALRGSVTVMPGTDLTSGTGEVWEAEI